jgi:hypothetical protein
MAFELKEKSDSCPGSKPPLLFFPSWDDYPLPKMTTIPPIFSDAVTYLLSRDPQSFCRRTYLSRSSHPSINSYPYFGFPHPQRTHSRGCVICWGSCMYNISTTKTDPRKFFASRLTGLDKSNTQVPGTCNRIRPLLDM